LDAKGKEKRKRGRDVHGTVCGTPSVSVNSISTDLKQRKRPGFLHIEASPI
jgi:hypothetical protein